MANVKLSGFSILYIIKLVDESGHAFIKAGYTLRDIKRHGENKRKSKAVEFTELSRANIAQFKQGDDYSKGLAKARAYSAEQVMHATLEQAGFIARLDKQGRKTEFYDIGANVPESVTFTFTIRKPITVTMSCKV